MRNLHALNVFRDIAAEHRMIGGPNTLKSRFGAFNVPFRTVKLRAIATADLGWDHVSVSLPNRCPNWPEMSFLAGLFFEEHETAMQLHVPASDHVNNHPYCLHWWRPHDVEIPRPPTLMVGQPGMTEKEVRALTIDEANALREAAFEALTKEKR